MNWCGLVSGALAHFVHGRVPHGPQQAQDAGRPLELQTCDFRLACGADGLQAGQRLVRA